MNIEKVNKDRGIDDSAQEKIRKGIKEMNDTNFEFNLKIKETVSVNFKILIEENKRLLDNLNEFNQEI